MATSPWCPRCGDWRGYNAKLCKGCQQIEAENPPLAADAPAELKQAQRAVLAKATAERFAQIGEKRVQREMYTQLLEEMVDRNVDVMRTLAFDWGRLRRDAQVNAFNNTLIPELFQAACLAVPQVAALSLELSKYTQNKAEHDERMQMVAAWTAVIQKFQSPDASQEVTGEGDGSASAGQEDGGSEEE